VACGQTGDGHMVDDRWVLERQQRDALGVNTLPEWKTWLRQNNVPLMEFIKKNINFDINEAIRTLHLEKIDVWLMDFVHTAAGFEEAKKITPEHPKQEQKDWDPMAGLADAGPAAVQMANGNVVVLQGKGGLVDTSTGESVAHQKKAIATAAQIGKTEVYGKGISVTPLVEGCPIQAQHKDQFIGELQEAGKEYKKLEKDFIAAGSKIIVMRNKKTEAIIEVENTVEARCHVFGAAGLSSGDWLVLDDHGKDVIIINGGPQDITGVDDKDIEAEFMKHKASRVFSVE
jgi:hypothetical protein